MSNISLISRGLLSVALALSAQLTVAGGPSASQATWLSADQVIAWSGVTIADEDLGALDPSSGTVTPMEITQLPPEVDLVGFHRFTSGAVLIAIDVTAAVGGITVERRDVARISAGAVSLELDGSAVGIPDGVGIDAVAWGPQGLLVSFDQTVKLSDAVTVDDEDLVAFGPGGPVVAFDGSAAGLAPELDIDAAHLDPDNGELLLSVDGAGSIGSVIFGDGDVLGWRSDLATWRVVASRPDDWQGADLDALYVAPAAEVPLFADGFESGGTTNWSSSQP